MSVLYRSRASAFEIGPMITGAKQSVGSSTIKRSGFIMSARAMVSSAARHRRA
jgi:hypothetical protein